MTLVRFVTQAPPQARVCVCVVRCSLFVVHDVVVRLDDDKNTRHRRSKSMLACNILEKEKKSLIPRLLLVSLDTATRIGTRNPSKSCQQRSCGLRPDLCLNRGYATPSSPCVDCSRNNAYEKISYADQHSLVGKTSFARHPSLMSHPAEAPLESHTKAQKLRRR